MYKYPNFNENLAAIIPCYDNTGDHTEIIFSNGTNTIVPLRVKTVLKQLARSQAIDISALRKKIELSTSRSLLQPLPLMPGLVLVPVKVRCPRVSGDNTMAYINFYKVTGVKNCNSKPYKCMIELSGARSLNCLWSEATVNKHLVLARLAAAETAGNLLNFSASYCRNNSFNSYQSSNFSHPSQAEINSLAAKLVEIIYDIKALRF